MKQVHARNAYNGRSFQKKIFEANLMDIDKEIDLPRSNSCKYTLK